MLESDRRQRILRTVTDTYGHTSALKDGTITVPRIALDFIEVKPINRAFKQMIADRAFDVSEMAIATYVQALALRKPFVLLPIVLMNRFHHGSIVRLTTSCIRDPRALEGKRVGVRAYSQTTGVWVRGILQHEYGVDLRTITWVVSQRGHLAEIDDPPNVVMAPAGSTLQQLLAEGEIDAWIGGRDADGVAGVEPLIADAARAEHRWFERTGLLPINHMLVIDRSIAEAAPWIAGDVVTVFTRAKERFYERLRRDGPQSRAEAFQYELLQRNIDPLPSDPAALRRSLSTVIDFTAEQGLIRTPMTVDELFQ